MAKNKEKKEEIPSRKELLIEYQEAQSSAEHHDNLGWSATASFWIGSLILLGFVINLIGHEENVKNNYIKALSTVICAFGVFLTIAVWYIAIKLRDIKRQKYIRCQNIETILGFKQHIFLKYSFGKLSCIYSFIMFLFLAVWIVTIVIIWLL